MDIQTLQYYLAVVNEGTISGAANAVHVAQPSLSRRMKELEEELGVKLFERGNRKITLTPEGAALRKRAEEMLRLMRITKEEIADTKNRVTGTVRIGAGESYSFHYLARAAGNLVKDYPDIRIEITSGDTRDLTDQLNNGLIDFALIFSPVERGTYQSITLPVEDKFCALMRRDCPLAKKEKITYSDLSGYPLIVSRTATPLFLETEELSSLKIAATYNLINNASLLVEDGLGIALCFDKLINTSGDSELCSRPLSPKLKSEGSVIWKKYETLSFAAEKFLNELKSLLPD